ncbi:MAG: DUF6978 family protein [Thermoguttaceae bacterium]
MTNINLSQVDADRLLAMEKHYLEKTVFDFPDRYSRIPLFSEDKSEEFYFDINRSGIKTTEITFNHRARQVIVLTRLDIDGAPHTNPDGEQLSGSHLHLYREDYQDRYAVELPPEFVRHSGDMLKLFGEMLMFCNVVTKPQTHLMLFV